MVLRMMSLEPLPCQPETSTHQAYSKYSQHDDTSPVSSLSSHMEYGATSSSPAYSDHQRSPHTLPHNTTDTTDLMLDRKWMSPDSAVSSGNEQSSVISSPEMAVSPGARRPTCQNERCRVCGDEATGMYFGAIVCVPCKTFFLRYAGDNFGFVCKHSRDCEITVASRTQCKYCRYQKCIEAGMCRRERPAQIQISEGQQQCVVCSDLANGVHFGAITCEGCKKFFRRGLQEHTSYSCKGQQDCVINPRTRNSCRHCRYQKCRKAGMSREAIQMGRPAKVRTMGAGNKDKTSPSTRSEAPSLMPFTHSPQGSNNMMASPSSKGYSGRQRFEMSSPYPSRTPSSAAEQDHSRNPSMSTPDSDVHSVGRQFNMLRVPHESPSGNLTEHKQHMYGPDFNMPHMPAGAPNSYINDNSAPMMSPPPAPYPGGKGSRRQTKLKEIISDLLSRTDGIEEMDVGSQTNIKQEPVVLDDHVVDERGQVFHNTTNFHQLPSYDIMNKDGHVNNREGGSTYPEVCSNRLTSINSHLDPNVHSNPVRNVSSQSWLPDGLGAEVIDIKQEPISLPCDSDFICEENLTIDVCTDDIIEDNPLQQILQVINESPSNPSTPQSAVDSSVFSNNLENKFDSSVSSHELLLNALIKLANTMPLSPRGRKDVDLPKVMPPPVTDKHLNLSPSPQNAPQQSRKTNKSWNPLHSNKFKDYWQNCSLPDENLMFEATHQRLIDLVMSAYHRFVATGTTINKELKNQLPLWMEKHGIGLEAAKSLLPGWINSKVVPVFTLTSFTFCRDLPGFLDLNPFDQAALIRLGQSQSRILVAAVHWYTREENDFRDFLAWRTMEPGQEDIFKKKLIMFAQEVNKLEVDTIEAALLNTLVVIATDYTGLIDEKIVEEKRSHILRAFRAYTTAKLGTPNTRIEDLFRIVPKLRELGLLQQRMTANANNNPPDSK